MSVYSSETQNADLSKNFSLGVVQEGNPEVSAGVFANNYKDKDNFTNRNISPTYGSVGATSSVTNPKAGASVTAQHIPTFGNQVTVAANANLSQGPNHRADVNAFTTRNMPKHGPNFSTHGAGISAELGRVGASASVAHTPMFKMTEQSIGSHINLHRSPNAAATVGVGASRICTPGNKTPWQPGVNFGFQKRF